jgi:single-strand DNA-binding protein
MLNRIVVIGRLTRDPELRSTSNGVAVATFTVAVDRNFANARGEKETDFIPVVVWRGLAETCGRYLAKGKLVAVEGRLQVRTYEANDGGKRTIAEIVADNVQFLSPKDGNSGGGSGYTPDISGEEMTPLDEIPF